MKNETLELEIDKKYRWYKSDTSGFIIFDDIIIKELYITANVLSGLDVLSIHHLDSFFKFGMIVVDGADFMVVDSDRMVQQPGYSRLLLKTRGEFPDLTPLSSLRECKHEWSDTGGLLWTFCKKCNATGSWSRTNYCYEVKK